MRKLGYLLFEIIQLFLKMTFISIPTILVFKFIRSVVYKFPWDTQPLLLFRNFTIPYVIVYIISFLILFTVVYGLFSIKRKVTK